MHLLFLFLKPRKVLLEQLSRVLPSDGDNLVGLPDQIILANTCDRQGKLNIVRLLFQFQYS